VVCWLQFLAEDGAIARVPYVAREELNADGQTIYDRIREDRGADEVGLQFRALLHNPQAAGYLTSMGASLRFQSSMPDDLKELAIILVAREWDSGIEWTGHSVAAARAGVSDDAIEGIRTGKAPECLDGAYADVARFVQQMTREKDVSDENFKKVHDLLGDRGVVDLTMTVSYYTALALAQIALRPEMGGGRVSTL
jgi:4-carboxymuconolactone decarboxylase